MTVPVQGFLLSEDYAMRERVEGITVSDAKAPGNSRKVRVWFGQPDQETTAQAYPYITLDMLDVTRDSSREHRGLINAPEYMARSANFDPLTTGTVIEYPIPVNIDYQITAYSRDPRHDREILTELTFNKLPLRGGSLELNDGTVRRLDVLDIAKRDVGEGGRRLFVIAVTARVSSEVAQGLLREISAVRTVHINDIININARVQTAPYAGYGLGDVTIT